jgi:hypothetical protein
MEKQESKRRFPTFPQPRRLRTITTYGIRILRARSYSSFEETVRELKRIRVNLPVIGISPGSEAYKDGADYLIPSHDPQALLNLLAQKFEAAKSDSDSA